MFNQSSQSTRTAPILYLGDTSLDSAAGYLAGVLSNHELDFDYVPSHDRLSSDQVAGDRRLFILSDYPAEQMSLPVQHELLKKVDSGAGLLMIGGWESFCGLGGNWAGTPVSQALPVEISTGDDRVNYDQVALLEQQTEHPILDGLPWDQHPPAIGGYNRLRVKPNGQCLLNVVLHSVSCSDGVFRFEAGTTDPMLVVGKYGSGRTAALATDLAPHWVGPLVDWGTENHPSPSGTGRKAAQAEGAEEVETGCLYDRFVFQLVSWTGRFE
jgi:uncharacterized membrane protein